MQVPINALWTSKSGSVAAEDVRPYLAPGVSLTVGLEPEADTARYRSLTALVAGRPSDRLLDAPALKHVIVPWAGVPAALRAQLLARPHLSLHNSHYNAPLVAQHALALVLACACRLVEADAHLRRGDWCPRYQRGFKSLALPGKRALLLGYGAIGQEVGRGLKALGMTVTALRRHSGEKSGEEGEVVERTFAPPQLHEALKGADVIVASLPETAETKDLLDANAFAAIKEGAILVNVGRGSAVVQEALYEALRGGRLFAAGLDVWWRYPENEAARAATRPADLPFWDLPNLIMSPHRANEMKDEHLLRYQDVAETLAALARGEPRNRVDPARGY